MFNSMVLKQFKEKVKPNMMIDFSSPIYRRERVSRGLGQRNLLDVLRQGTLVPGDFGLGDPRSPARSNPEFHRSQLPAKETGCRFSKFSKWKYKNPPKYQSIEYSQSIKICLFSEIIFRKLVRRILAFSGSLTRFLQIIRVDDTVDRENAEKLRNPRKNRRRYSRYFDTLKLSGGF